MLKNQNIVIGLGLGDLRFGMNREEAKAILGEPDEIEVYTDAEEDDNKTETWHFDELEMSVSFDEFTNWILVTIAISGIEYNFEGLQLVGLDYENVIKKITKLELGPYTTEIVPDDDGMVQKLVSFDDVSVSFWFEENILSEVIWGPIWDDDEI